MEPEAPLPDPKRHTPRWAFEPWISKDISTGADTRDFVRGFEERGIPVGVVVLDSPWETHYNTFEPNPSRYPEFGKMVEELHAKGIRVVLWTTSFVNVSGLDLEPGGDTYVGPHPRFEEGLACGFYVNDGVTEFWWKGRGASVDFFDARARAWFHRMQDRVLDQGIDGWKLDFGESYIQNLPIRTDAGDKTLQAYSEEYYADFLRYGVAKRGPEFLTMVRAWDESYQHAGRFYARKEHAPVAWMGDNRRDFVGLADALDHMFRSARAGYAVVGSDLGGYLDRDDKNLTVEIPYSHEAFARWVAMGAMTPFMQLHGRANLTPWTVPVDPDGFVALYKYWSVLHHELVPFLYSTAEEAYAGAEVPVQPVGEEGAWAGDYRYVLGGAFLVAPILDESGVRDVPLPAGSRWYDWWDPAGPARDGGATVSSYDARNLAKMPLFVREGAIVPARVGSDLTGLGAAASKDALTIAVWPAQAKSAFTLHDEDEQTTRVEAQRVGGSATITLSRTKTRAILRVRADAAPAQVTVGGVAAPKLVDRAAFDAATSGWLDDAARKLVWVHVPAAAYPTSVVVGP
jgi:alpha-glucosidase (family GH31 glycosyl hydrolase)